MFKITYVYVTIWVTNYKRVSKMLLSDLPDECQSCSLVFAYKEIGLLYDIDSTGGEKN